MKSLNFTYFLFFFIAIGCSNSTDSNENTNPNTNATVTDVDGNIYQTITICNQVWAQKNLQVSHYKNGDIVPQVTDATQWKNLTTGAWCYYNNDPSTESTYGKLYNWYAVADPRGLAPVGWHVPSDAEYNTLIENCLGGFGEAGGKMKEIGTTNWDSPNTLATNSSGFTALPGGYRTFSGNFDYIRKQGNFWSTTEENATRGKFLTLLNTISNATRSDIYKFYGFSVRCVKD
jgi:uncharacterized protein (TIGR02145 family)